MNKVEIIFPDSTRRTVVVKGRRAAGSLATYLAKQYGLDVKRTRWQLRGPLGVLHPQKIVKNEPLEVGECLKLEQKV
jgi:hypothetical protein